MRAFKSKTAKQLERECRQLDGLIVIVLIAWFIVLFVGKATLFAV